MESTTTDYYLLIQGMKKESEEEVRRVCKSLPLDEASLMGLETAETQVDAFISLAEKYSHFSIDQHPSNVLGAIKASLEADLNVLRGNAAGTAGDRLRDRHRCISRQTRQVMIQMKAVEILEARIAGI